MIPQEIGTVYDSTLARDTVRQHHPNVPGVSPTPLLRKSHAREILETLRDPESLFSPGDICLGLHVNRDEDVRGFFSRFPHNIL